MKFLAKTLVAAVALSVSSMASAATTLSGNSSFWLTLIDRDTSTAAVFDTGLTYNALNTIGAGAVPTFTVPFELDLSGNSAFNSFISAASNNVVYALFAGDRDGVARNAGTLGMIISYDLREDTSNLGLSRTLLVGSNANIDVAIADNSLVDYYSSDKASGNALTTVRELGEAMGLIQYVNNSNNTTSNYIFADSNNNAINVNFTRAGMLTIDAVSAVPEAETYAMFMAGLGLMGAMLRRRKAA